MIMMIICLQEKQKNQEKTNKPPEYLAFTYIL